VIFLIYESGDRTGGSGPHDGYHLDVVGKAYVYAGFEDGPETRPKAQSGTTMFRTDGSD
jgi:hypothetical protein